MEATDGSFFDSAVHPFNLPVGPRAGRACQAMLDSISMADHVKLMRFVGLCSAPFNELRAVVCQYGVNPIQ